jgi:hypothetical protein
MSVATVGIAKADIFHRRLKRMTDRVVVGSQQCRRLTTVNQQEGQAGRSRKFLLYVLPSERSVFRVFLDDFRWIRGGALFGQSLRWPRLLSHQSSFFL